MATATTNGGYGVRETEDGGGLVNRDNRIIVVLGATGSGKSRLSIDLATIFPGEIINSDKMQLYKGLDITTNKLPLCQRRGVPHHHLGEFDPLQGELFPSDYRRDASATISDIWSRRKLPVLAGGSNSFIYALLASKFDPDTNVFDHHGSTPVSSELRYNCCFLWMDVAPPVLDEYLRRRVDDMLNSGMFEELAEFFDSEGFDPEDRPGLRKAIGVPEFAHYFQQFPGPKRRPQGMLSTRFEAYQEALEAIKDNTCQLAKRQVGKIKRLRADGWELRRIDATDVFRKVLAADSCKATSDAIWKTRVVGPSVEIVKRFVEQR